MTDMRIVGCLIWYDESPSWLAAAVAGFGRVCDTIIAVDGSYLLYPGARARSHPDQADAIQMACEASGAGLLLHRPKDIFLGNELEKRNLSLRLAGSLDPDWVMVFDADYHVMQVRPELVRRDLAETDLNVATYTTYQEKDILADDKIADRVASFPIDTGWTLRTRDVYRWTDDLIYGPAHYTIRGTYNGVEEWIRGPEMLIDSPYPTVDALDLGASLVVYHRNEKRALVREQARRGYYARRDTVGAESLGGWGAVVAA